MRNLTRAIEVALAGGLLLLLGTALLACGGKVGGPEEPPGPVPPSRNVTGPVMATPFVGDDAGAPSPPIVTPIVEYDAGVPSPPIGTPGVPMVIVGDGGGPTTPPETTQNDGGTIDFAPTAIDVERYPTVCGVMNPPFMTGDLYSMDVIGNMAHAPYDALSINFPDPTTVGTPLALNVEAFSAMSFGVGQPDGGVAWYAGQNAQLGNIYFQYSQGSSPTDVDPNPFDSVAITIVAMPAKDGDPLRIRVQIHFVDDRVLDETFSGPLYSSWGGCPAG